MKVDFLNTPDERSIRRSTALLAAIFTLFVGVLAAIGAHASYTSASHGSTVLGDFGQIPVISDIRKLVLGDTANANPDKSPDGRLNIMLFGIGGAGHDGSQLTDTIILASIDTTAKRVGLLSIPRDTAYPLGGTRFQKINAVNAYAESSHPNEGAIVAAQDIGKLLGVRIDHVIKIDFQGFEKFINALGGIDIEVERDFVDPKYPTINDLWQTVSFRKGQQHMTGAQALIYVRSRHGSNGEGSDFARSRRQQLVMNAVRDKLLSLGTLGNPKKIAELWGLVAGHIQTDLTAWDFVSLAPLASSIDREHIVNHVLTDDVDGELVAGNIEGAGYMLFPKKPDWSDIRSLAQNPFETKEERASQERPSELIRLEIKNGTTRTGFAAQAAASLKRNGYVVTATGNALQRGYERSVIFDLTGGKKPAELARLKKTLNASISSVSPTTLSTTSSHRIVYSDGLTAEPITASSSEFLIILGESSLGLFDQYASQTTP